MASRLSTVTAALAALAIVALGCSDDDDSPPPVAAVPPPIAAFENASFVATYRLDSTVSEPGFPSLGPTTSVFYKDGDRAERWDSRPDVSDPSHIETRIITDNVAVECESDSKRGGQCWAAPEAVPSFATQMFGSASADAFLQGFEEQGFEEFDQEIAGESATCYQVRFDDDDGDETENGFCFARDGVLLAYNVTSDKVDIRIEATHVERSVDASVFEPPFPIIANSDDQPTIDVIQ